MIQQHTNFSSTSAVALYKTMNSFLVAIGGWKITVTLDQSAWRILLRHDFPIDDGSRDKSIQFVFERWEMICGVQRAAGGGKMADGGPDERQCIGSINRALKRYGSTCNHVKRPPSDGCVRAVIRHEIEEGDTLQGLALKYGTTVRRPLSRCTHLSFLGTLHFQTLVFFSFVMQGLIKRTKRGQYLQNLAE